MSNSIEIRDSAINWIEKAINEGYFKYYEYKHFSNIKPIGSGGFGKVSCANWKKAGQCFALKSFFNLDNVTINEINRELKFQREVDYHDNIIRFCGITKVESENDEMKSYCLVMEYADGGSLRNYLKKNFDNLNWDDKYNMAYQLACAVSCLHDEEIMHHDLHSGNVLVHQNIIKLADFGLSKRIEKSSNFQQNFQQKQLLFGVVPYIDPKTLSSKQYSLNEKSDVYSIGVLLWEISSGKRPFEGEEYGIDLINEILGGRRETDIPDTPRDYVKVYTECWDGEPNIRPTIGQVVSRLGKNININLGLCQPVESSSKTNDIYGVIPFMAPEVLRHKPYTLASDIYSFSMIMWEFTSGVPPFNGRTHDLQLCLSICKGERPEIIENTPRCYIDLMRKCWNEDPLKRPSALEVSNIIEKWINPINKELKNNIMEFIKPDSTFKTNRNDIMEFNSNNSHIDILVSESLDDLNISESDLNEENDDDDDAE